MAKYDGLCRPTAVVLLALKHGTRTCNEAITRLKIRSLPT